MSLTDIAWVLAASERAAGTGTVLDEGLVNRLRYPTSASAPTFPLGGPAGEGEPLPRGPSAEGPQAEVDGEEFAALP